MSMINMNTRGAEIFLGFMLHGENTMKVKLGHKIYTLEINKTIIDAHVTLHGVGSFVCRPDALLTREVLEHTREIEQAQAIQRKFRAIF